MMSNPIQIVLTVDEFTGNTGKCFDSLLGQTAKGFSCLVVSRVPIPSEVKERFSGDSRFSFAESASPIGIAVYNEEWKFRDKDYLTFLNGEDFLDRDALLTMAEVMAPLKGCPAGFSWSRTVDEDGNLISEEGHRHKSPEEIVRGKVPIYFAFIRTPWYFAIGGLDKLMRYGAAEQDLYRRIAVRGDIAEVPKYLHNYRKHSRRNEVKWRSRYRHWLEFSQVKVSYEYSECIVHQPG